MGLGEKIKVGEKINYLNAKKIANDGLKDILVSKDSIYGKFLHNDIKISDKEEDIFKDYRLLISNQWSGIQINNSQPESISPQFYFHINSIDLYDKARSIIEK